MKKTEEVIADFNTKDIEWTDMIAATNTHDTKKTKYTIDEKGRRMVKTPEGWKFDNRPSQQV